MNGRASTMTTQGGNKGKPELRQLGKFLNSLPKAEGKAGEEPYHDAFMAGPHMCGHCGEKAVRLEGLGDISVGEKSISFHYGECSKCGWTFVECGSCGETVAVRKGDNAICGCDHTWGLRDDGVGIEVFSGEWLEAEGEE
jgi:hypothetical protein